MAQDLQSGGNNNAPVYTTIPVQRTISSGTTAMVALATTDVSTVTRNAGERIVPAGFITDAVANVGLTQGVTISGDGIAMELRCTAVANQVKLTLICGATGRTLDWMVLGFV
jgi:hypothetical protein